MNLPRPSSCLRLYPEAKIVIGMVSRKEWAETHRLEYAHSRNVQEDEEADENLHTSDLWFFYKEDFWSLALITIHLLGKVNQGEEDVQIRHRKG